MTKREAIRLANALTAQLERRKPMLGAESLLAYKMIPAFPPTIPTPPDWALAACRIVDASFAKELVPQPGNEIGAKELGAAVGMGATWKAFLAHPDENLEALEKKIPELAGFRERIAILTEPSFKMTDAIEAGVPKLPIGAQEVAEFNKGRAVGAAAIVDDDGELRDIGTIKQEVSFYVWLYWEQIEKLRSLADLMKFLREFQVEGLTQQNLEKICRELGLRLKARGRPKNILPKKRSR